MSDGDLYTGMTSATPRARKVLENERKVKEKSTLLPVAELIFDTIEKEKAKVQDVTDFIVGVETPIEDVKADLIARKRYVQYLTELQIKFKVTLKAEPKVVKNG